MSRVPWKRAVREEGEQVRWEVEEPPRTRSSDDVHSDGFQALSGCGVSEGVSWCLGGEAYR